MKNSSVLQLIFILSLLFIQALPSFADLVAHWTLDEGAGAIAGDSTGNGNTGAIAGGTTWQTANLPLVPAGTTAALRMNGVDGAINIAGFKGITGSSNRSVTAWIRTNLTTPAQDSAIAAWGNNIATNKWVIRIQDDNGTPGAVRVEVNGGYFVGNTVVTDGQWHHVAVIWANDGTPNVQDALIYVDGVLDAELDSATVPPSASLSQTINTAVGADVKIGAEFNVNNNWNGDLDDVRIYDEAIDAITVETLAAGTPIISSFETDAEIVASGAPVVLSWVSDPANDTLVIDNGVGDVSGLSMTTVNPTADTTYKLSGTRGATTIEQEVTVLVGKLPIINSYSVEGSTEILAGSSVQLSWDIFGEVSVDLNGSDVTGQSLTMERPTQTTVYTLSATNAFGTSTAVVTVTVLAETNPDLSWSAAGLPDGGLTTWNPIINVTGNEGIVFNRNTTGTVVSGASNFSNITQWVNSPGYNLSSTPGDSWQDGLGNAATQTNVSWEMVFRPGDFTGFHVLFNTGGNGDGTAFTLDGSVLDFRFQDANSAAQRVTISTDLANIGAATDFYHVVGLADVDTANSGTGSLYVNGVLVAGPTTSTGTIVDWDGGDLAEIGKGNNIPDDSPSNAVAFTGDVALLNYYGARILSELQIADIFAAIGGGSSQQEFKITSIFYNDVEQRIELTFNSRPGLIYSIDESIDMTSWSEVDDTVNSQGTLTTFFTPGITLPDPEAPRNYYRVRLQQ
ncbi:MAG: hypothetical protein ACI9NC_005524 [Verrucomicrobiales bacterium]|jgi:hypothetical protein